jgi:hypothetical protein
VFTSRYVLDLFINCLQKFGIEGLIFHTIITVHFYESNQINRPTNALFDYFYVVYKSQYFHISEHHIYREYTKERCGLYVYIHINLTILLCIPCISHKFNKVLTKYIHIYVLQFYPDNSGRIIDSDRQYASDVRSFKHVLVLVVLTTLSPLKMDLGPKHV